ncbi:MAG: hypothetical protein V3R99_00700 [Thermoguttaceae bacterium]
MAITISLAGPLGHASAALWIEPAIDDAGALPGSAQTTVGLGSLDGIQGRLAGVDDIDMFAILVTDVSAFSATTVAAGTELLDTQLFLFDSAGRGIAANDDTRFDERNATIPLGTVSGDPGLYYLAVSEWMDKPISTAGDIFPAPFSPGEVVGPDGPGGANPIITWDVDSFSFPGEAYEIVLTGAEFLSVIPEPSGFVVWGLIGLIVFGFGFARRSWTIAQQRKGR